jgi:hypothetical protein
MSKIMKTARRVNKSLPALHQALQEVPAEQDLLIKQSFHLHITRDRKWLTHLIGAFMARAFASARRSAEVF